MLDAFLSGVAPILAVVAIGYGARRLRVFDAAAATSLNRFVFQIALPALLVGLIARTPLSRIDWAAMWAYLAVEAVVYAIAFGLARLAFRRSVVESLLLGLSAALANHVFIVYPISLAVYGDEFVRQIAALILLDSVFIFAATIVMVDLAMSGAVSPKKVGASLVRNPPILGVALGVVIAAAEAPLPLGAARFIDFLGAAAPPASLFALGVVLAERDPFEEVAAPLAIAAVKLALAPALAVWMLSVWPGVSAAAINPTLLTAAGPCGAMAFVIGLRFGAPVATVARAILFSTALSAVSLSALIALV